MGAGCHLVGCGIRAMTDHTHPLGIALTAAPFLAYFGMGLVFLLAYLRTDR